MLAGQFSLHVGGDWDFNDSRCLHHKPFGIDLVAERMGAEGQRVGQFRIRTLQHTAQCLNFVMDFFVGFIIGQVDGEAEQRSFDDDVIVLVGKRRIDSKER